jgi:uncharacterized protein (DUF2236 family)
MSTTDVPARGPLGKIIEAYAGPKGVPSVDFTQPAGEAALAAPNSVSWQVFKNPVSLFIGGTTAVLLELAEPRVRSGVWDHTSFRTDPLPRMARTGLAAMVTVYGAKSVAEGMIAGVGRMHARVGGVTPAGEAYQALDQELLDWVQATASFGFLHAYHNFVRPLGQADRDRFYAEAAPAARLYGALGAPTSEAKMAQQFEAMRPKLEQSEIVFEFLDIMRRTPAAPGPLRPLQNMFIRAGVEILPGWARDTLRLETQHRLRPWECRLVRLAGAAADRVVLTSAPPAQACQRLGLPASYLYRRP